MYYPCSENKGADQLRGYREADLRLCFRICRLLVFSLGGSNVIGCFKLLLNLIIQMLIEEHTLERDGTQEKKLLAKLSIYNRPGDDAHLGELYLDHDYVENKSQGATCK